jgi:hypothetical protein
MVNKVEARGEESHPPPPPPASTFGLREHAAQDFHRLVALLRGDIEGRQQADGLLAGGNDEQARGRQPVGQAQGRRAFLAFPQCEIFHFDAEEQSGPAHFAHEG